MRPLSILHRRDVWLRRSENWIHGQLSALPDAFRNHVLCDRLSERASDYPVDSVHTYSDPFQRVPYLGERLDRLKERPYAGYGLRVLSREHFNRRLGAVIDQTGARVVHSHFGFTAWLDRVAVRRRGVGHVVTFYGYDVGALPTREPIWRERYDDLFGSVSLVLCEGESMAASIADLGCPPHKIKVHRIGIDPNAFPFYPRTLEKDETPIILMAARFAEKKGIPDGLAAIAQMDRNARVRIVGGTTGPRSRREKRRILEAIDAHSLGERVDMLGELPHDELIEEALRCHVFLAPSKRASSGDIEGGAPVTLIEMMATGMPIVSTRHCDIPNVVVDGLTGLLAPEGHVEALAARLDEMVSRSDTWDEIAQAARRRVDLDFDVRRQAKKLAAHYRTAAVG
jgi:colanic acid/amylovoran biosynthesis glycosyltransferase